MVVKNRYVGQMLTVTSLTGEGKLLTVDAWSFGPVRIELQFTQGIDAAKLLQDHNMKQICP